MVGLRATVRVWLRVLLTGVGLSVWLIVRLSARVAAACACGPERCCGSECRMGLGVRSWLRLSAARGWLGLGLGPALGVLPNPKRKKT